MVNLNAPASLHLETEGKKTKDKSEDKDKPEVIKNSQKPTL